MKRTYGIIPFLILFLLILPILLLAGQFKVTRVYDGDTVKAEGHDIEIKVRLVGIDTLERSRKKGRPGERFTNSLGMEFVYIPPGAFKMGSPTNEKGRDDDETQHEVTVSRPFYIQNTEVTQGQWNAVMGNNPSYFFKDCGDDCPVENVSWNDVKEFIRKLNKMEGTEKYRLPTEAQWEYACRAGTTTAFADGQIVELESGNDPNLDAMVWYSSNAGGKTHPVARKKPNAWGLYDMHGNVWEWCQDWHGEYPSGSVTDPTGPSSGSYRVIRGGSWFSSARRCRSANRLGDTPSGMELNIGFRLVRDK